MWKKDPSLRNLSATRAERKDIAQAAARARKLLRKRALISAAASTIPIPGLDWAADAALLAQLYPRINQEFGLTPEQLDQLTPGKREQVQKAVAMVGSVLIGKFITRDMVLRLGKAMGLRMSTRQAAKYVPLLGQLAAASIGYATLRYLGERHIQDCMRVVEEAELDIPGRWLDTRNLLQRNSDLVRSWQQQDRGPWQRGPHD
ncbi:hypothetical protein DJFAAGMI_01085 [Comamonas sp. PE63]|jgi:uncharacterized protein (DUF697 family)|uniref:DUF697 domain-containing protein n=2 Tax=Comamonas TaxID=283 RepID=B7WUP2_COMTK|nr:MULTISPECIES: hypothetical protein [Comamonas]EED67555.1 conserved hypothetical protein [Comamonas testosteroni KF-1]MBS3018353.1 hypothetical protein [Comamonas sp. PE63]TYK69915.1 hypothetical protein FSY59_16500 [Comamonas sp. Z3]WQG65701.1 hypothetical protein SR914_21385 [Comamonas testosteroni]